MDTQGILNPPLSQRCSILLTFEKFHAGRPTIRPAHHVEFSGDRLTANLHQIGAGCPHPAHSKRRPQLLAPAGADCLCRGRRVQSMKAAKTNAPIRTAISNAMRPKKNLFMLGDAGTTISFRVRLCVAKLMRKKNTAVKVPVG
jgi:hypothetical protein